MPNDENQQSSETAAFVRGDSPRGRPHFDLSSFKLEQATLELRYSFAFELWDKSGVVWQSIQERWPDIIPVHAEPTKTSFRVGRSTLMIEAEAARITTVQPERSLEEFGKSAKHFMTSVVQHLRIGILNRIGFRTIYFRDFDDRERAAAAFLSLGLMTVPEGKKFEVSDHPVNPQYSLRWESETKGTLVRLRAETRKLDFDPPPEIAEQVTPIHDQKNRIVLDVDYYTVAPVEPAQVDAAEWIKHAVHLINRDTKYLFGE